MRNITTAISLGLALCVFSHTANAARRHGGELAQSSPEITSEPAPVLPSSGPTDPVKPIDPAPPIEKKDVPADPNVLERVPNQVAQENYGPPGSAEWFVNLVTRSVSKSYGYVMTILGLRDETKSMEERGRVAVHRTLWVGGLLVVLVLGALGYFLFRRREKVHQQMVAESHQSLEKNFVQQVVDVDENSQAGGDNKVFDPQNRPYRVALIERDGAKLAILEILDPKIRQIIEAQDLVPGAVILAQYLPAERQMQIGVLNGLEQVKYLSGWEFMKTNEEVRIYVRNTPSGHTHPGLKIKMPIATDNITGNTATAIGLPPQSQAPLSESSISISESEGESEIADSDAPVEGTNPDKKAS